MDVVPTRRKKKTATYETVGTEGVVDDDDSTDSPTESGTGTDVDSEVEVEAIAQRVDPNEVHM